MADTNKTIEIIEGLVEICRDGQNGFRESAQHVKDPAVRELFNELSLERAQFVGELQSSNSCISEVSTLQIQMH